MWASECLCSGLVEKKKKLAGCATKTGGGGYCVNSLGKKGIGRSN